MVMSVRFGFVLITGLLLGGPVLAREQILTLNSENDLYTGTGDAYYTNGARAAWLDADFRPPALIEELAERLPFFDPANPMVVQYSIGQNLYTPEDITIAAPQPNDRPWAGYLYGSIGITEGNRKVVNDMELSLGWVGPGALGEQTQKFVHQVVGARRPNGWANQLHDEPALNLSLQRRWPTFGELDVGPTRVTLAPHVGIAAGNVYTHAATGLTLRWDSDKDAVLDNPVRVRPAPPGTGYFQTSQTPILSLFTGVEGRAVARNIFLDGNTFGSSPSVDKKALVADLQAGAMVTYKRFQLGYTAVYRSPEFYGQKNGQVFGAISLAIKF